MMRAMHPVDLFWRGWDAIVGPSGWRSLIGPVAFATLGIALLVYDHLNQRVTDVVFWLTLLLIVAIFGRMLETNRKQSRDLEQRRREEFADRATALPNRRRLEADLELVVAVPGEERILVLLELDGLQEYGDRLGRQAEAELLRNAAQGMLAATAPLGGKVYRVDTSRLAALLPRGARSPGEVALAPTASQEGDVDSRIGRAYGEVAIPAETADPEVAFKLAGQRLAAHRRRQHRSARRQAHAALMAALSARRPELRHHLRSVAYRAISLGRRLGLTPEAIDDVALAAELQEVGLLAVPEAVLEKQSPLSEEERAMLLNHPAEGARIVAAAAGLEPVAALVRSSAERYDGSGFPDGLAGEAIPLGSRIVAAAVAFAALTAQRPYRESLGPDGALAELRRCSGTQFDPNVVEALAAELAEEARPAAAPA
jgi:two-component system, cell cycle response regulator